MRKVLVIAIIIFFIGMSVPLITGNINKSGNNINQDADSGYKSSVNSYSAYIPEDINLEDAAFHRSYTHYHLEWWYFEGIFYNSYKVVVGTVIISKNHRGLCLVGLHINDGNEWKYRLHKIVPFKDFKASEKFPLIIISNKQIIRLDREIYNKTGDWVYNVSFKIDDQEAHLHFAGITDGYKGEILRGWYGPVLPKATVNGTLILNGDSIEVSGIGYHEHAWQIPLPIYEWGFYWSKIVSDSFTLFLGKMMQNRGKEQTRAAILSQDHASYTYIKPEYFQFKTAEYIFDNRRIIPTKFIINVTDPENSIYVNATMDAITTLHISSAFRISHYWRYLVIVNGQISCDSTTEKIKDEIQILEFTRFH